MAGPTTLMCDFCESQPATFKTVHHEDIGALPFCSAECSHRFCVQLQHSSIDGDSDDHDDDDDTGVPTSVQAAGAPIEPLNPAHKGMFTRWEQRHGYGKKNGHLTAKGINAGLHSKNAHVRKMAAFAKAARKWHH